MRSFSETLLMLLRATGTSNTTLANGCGVSRPAVNGWLNGRDPSFKNVVSVCNFFQVTPNEIAGFDDLSDDRISEVVSYRKSVAPNSVRVELNPVEFSAKDKAESEALADKVRAELSGGAEQCGVGRSSAE